MCCFLIFLELSRFRDVAFIRFGNSGCLLESSHASPIFGLGHEEDGQDQLQTGKTCTEVVPALGRDGARDGTRE